MGWKKSIEEKLEIMQWTLAFHTVEMAWLKFGLCFRYGTNMTKYSRVQIKRIKSFKMLAAINGRFHVNEMTKITFNKCNHVIWAFSTQVLITTSRFNHPTHRLFTLKTLNYILSHNQPRTKLFFLLTIWQSVKYVVKKVKKMRTQTERVAPMLWSYLSQIFNLSW